MNKISFKILTKDGLSLLHKWHNAPHVKEWYDKDKDLSKIELVQDKYKPILTKSEPTQAYIIYLENNPIGYIQTYLIRDYPSYSKYLRLDEEAAGVDLFIGEPDYVHKGLGSKIIKQFLKDFVFSKLNIVSCIVGPEPKNKAGIRAYEKSGFVYFKTVQLSDEPEPEYLMRITRNEL